MRFFTNWKEGFCHGLCVGYAFSSAMTLNSTDFELATGGSLNCLLTMFGSAAAGGVFGFFNSLRRDPREEMPDNVDKAVMAACFFGLFCSYMKLPGFSSFVADLKQRYEGGFSVQLPPLGPQRG